MQAAWSYNEDFEASMLAYMDACGCLVHYSSLEGHMPISFGFKSSFIYLLRLNNHLLKESDVCQSVVACKAVQNDPNCKICRRKHIAYIST